MFHIEGIWAFPGADYIFAAFLLIVDLLIVYLSRTFIDKI